ncbi:hypothetical protein [Algirhabdus cladophorae]|uniref:hypothetical protein n=1 Tax=Algirhabdus cladophorae TaxID=3377108 RepID=UPI003B84753D
MTDMTLLTHQYSLERGGFEAIVMVASGTSKRRFDCFFAAHHSLNDRAIIKGLLQDAKQQFQNTKTPISGLGFPMSPNMVRYTTT